MRNHAQTRVICRPIRHDPGAGFHSSGQFAQLRRASLRTESDRSGFPAVQAISREVHRKRATLSSCAIGMPGQNRWISAIHQQRTKKNSLRQLAGNFLIDSSESAHRPQRCVFPWVQAGSGHPSARRCCFQHSGISMWRNASSVSIGGWSPARISRCKSGERKARRRSSRS